MHSIIRYVLHFFQRHKNTSLLQEWRPAWAWSGSRPSGQAWVKALKYRAPHTAAGAPAPRPVPLGNGTPSSGWVSVGRCPLKAAPLSGELPLADESYFVRKLHHHAPHQSWKSLANDWRRTGELGINHLPCLKGDQLRFSPFSRESLGSGWWQTPILGKPLPGSFLLHSSVAENMSWIKHKDTNPCLRLTENLT